MIKRIVEISHPSYLRLQHRQLVIEQNHQRVGQIPIEDLGILILDNPAIVPTQAVLVACWEAGAVIVLCDASHTPGAILQPLVGHTLHCQILEQQVRVTTPTKKRLWQQIVKAKITGQANVLRSVGKAYKPVEQYARKVQSGDPQNIEAQAARIYWPRLFGADFRRRIDYGGVNALLNYGYAVVRAAVARAISGAGLHPALGIHHSNQYNAFCLADDLVEPLRPIVDIRVRELVDGHGIDVEITKDIKQSLLDVLSWSVNVGERTLPLLVALQSYAVSVREVIAGNLRVAEIPAI